MNPTRDSRTQAQRSRLEQFGAAACVDVHCHCLPGLDDGPETMDQAVALCRALADDGLTAVIATPHQFGRYDGRNEADEVRAAVSALNAALARESIPLIVVPGADVRVDERLVALLEADRALTLADGGRYLLQELPHEVFMDLRLMTGALAARGITPIISHPERHVSLARRPDLVLPWLAEGAVLQITAGSLVGDFGPVAQQAAWQWLASGAAALVATDAHDTRGRGPRMSAAVDAIAGQLGAAAAGRACIDNPLRVMEGKELSISTRGREVRPRR